MRRMEKNLGEKRVLLGSVDKKTHLRIAYERLNLEEKAFLSSTKFNRRQLLNRQHKLRQLSSQGNKGVRPETRPKTRTRFPNVPGVNESSVRDYSNNLKIPQSRKSLRSAGGKVQPSSSLARESTGLENLRESGDIRKPNFKSNSSSYELIDFRDRSNYEQGETKSPPLKQKSPRVEKHSVSKLAQSSGIRVDDIIAYSSNLGKREKPKKGSLSDRANEDTVGQQETQSTNERSFVTKQTLWKRDEFSAESSERKKSSSTKLLEDDAINTMTHATHSENTFDQRTPTSDDTHFEDVFSLDTDAPSQESYSSLNSKSTLVELESDSHFIAASSQSPQISEANDPDVSTSVNETARPIPLDRSDSTAEVKVLTGDDPIERPLSSVPLVSRTPSWNGTKVLPALGRIRRGSFCDVKTFTSSKVLDLLSSCELPIQEQEEKKSDKQFLDVENDNLKYCRYLRSVTPEAAAGKDVGEPLVIPQKYRPSKNIIIGHTKINLHHS